MTTSNETRLDELEEAFMLMIAGRAPEATEDDKHAVKARFDEIMGNVRGRFVERKENKT